MHTPGPWYAENDAVYKDYGDKRYTVAIASDSAEILANARLIAAAPDLLAALKLVAGCVIVRQPEMDAVRAAIAKAEVRS